MRAIYKNQKVPFIGSFIMFIQSPAGWICIILILIGVIGTPILDKKLLKFRHERYLLINPVSEIEFKGDEIDSKNPRNEKYDKYEKQD